MMDEHVSQDTRQIRRRLESVEHMQRVILRSQEDLVLKDFWKEVDRGEVIALMYLLIDGSRTQSEIVDELKRQDIRGGSHAAVSRRMDKLKDLNAIELLDITSSGRIYRRSALDNILNVGKKLQRRRLQRREEHQP
jgi:hypothetical protein